MARKTVSINVNVETTVNTRVVMMRQSVLIAAAARIGAKSKLQGPSAKKKISDQGASVETDILPLGT